MIYLIVGFGIEIWIGLRMLGMNNGAEIKIPEYVEITADVKEFKLEFTATLISGGILKELKEKDIKKF